MEKGFILPLTIAIVAVLILGVGGFVAYTQYSEKITQDQIETETETNTQDTEDTTTDQQETNTNETTTQQQSEIAGWKTYTNTEYGFEFKYPVDWEYQEFSCNIEGVAFCPAKIGVVGCGMTCSASDESSVISFAFSPSINKNNLTLWKENYRDIYNKMLSTFKFTK